MKAKILNDEREFKPFELNIAIESKRDLEVLWCIFNAPASTLSQFCNDNICGEKIELFRDWELSPYYNLWELLNNKLFK